MKRNKLLWLLFGVFLLLGVSKCNSSKNNDNIDKREIFTSSAGVGIPPQVLPTTPTAEGEAFSVNDAKAGAVMAGQKTGSTGQTDVDRSFRYEHMACFELSQNEKRAVAGVRQEEALTPSVCMARCYRANRVGAFMIRGDVCVCLYTEIEMDFFLLDRKPGLCRAPCSGDSTAMCGGRTAYSLLRLLDNEDVQEDLSQPSVDEVTQLAGSSTTVDGPTDPKTEGSIGAGAESGGSISRAASGDRDRDIAAAADFGDDPQEGTVEAVNPNDDAEKETDADMTINDPGSAKETNSGRSSLEYMGCLKLDSAERRKAATLPRLAKMTPTVCIRGCRNDEAVFVAMVRGDVCMCAYGTNPDVFFPERWTGICASPCVGDATLTCGGEDSVDLFKLSYEKDSKENAQQAGVGTFADTSNGPGTDGSMDDGVGSIGPASPSPGAAAGATDIAAAAPEFSDDPRVGTVEALNPPDDAKAEPDVVVTEKTSGEAKDTSASRSALSKHIGCLKLDFFESHRVGMVSPLAEMTPTVCIQGCRGEGAAVAAMALGDVCMCAHAKDAASVLVQRDTGVCASPCIGDATLTCGGKDSIDLFKLSYEEDSEDPLLQPSVDDAAQQAGSGTTTDISHGLHTEGSMDDEPAGTAPQDYISMTAFSHPPSATAGAFSNQDIFQPRTGTVHLKGRLFGWWKRELSIVNEDKLRLCKAKRVWNTGSCEEASLDDRSEIVAVLNPKFKKRKGVRHPFRVTTTAPGAKSSRVWTLDAGSEEEMNAWVSLLKGIVARARAGNGRPTVDDSNTVKYSALKNP